MKDDTQKVVKKRETPRACQKNSKNKNVSGRKFSKNDGRDYCQHCGVDVFNLVHGHQILLQ